MTGRLVAALIAGLLAASPAAAAGPDTGTDAQREAGQKLYGKYCVQCHGVAGDGKGPAAQRLKPKPRDFTRGAYKIRTTPSGSLPTTGDIVSIIRRGVPYTSMPAWPQFSNQDLHDLAYYVKSFSPRFADPAEAPEDMDLPAAPSFSDESAGKGKEIYARIGCPQCHGDLARGDGPSAPTLKDDWGDHIRPADLTKRWTFRGGPHREDIFRAFTTALNGTPMPSYADSLSVDDRWDLTDYIWSLSGGDDAGYDGLVVARKVAVDLDASDGEDLFAGAEPAYFPVIGQIMEPGREFYPSANGVTVRAVYNDGEVAVEVRWHDMRAETSGHNAPDLSVPRFEDDPFRGDNPAGGAQGETAAAEDDFWGSGEAETPAPSEPAADDFWAEEPAGTGAQAAADPTTEFSDAVAIQFPSEIPTGNRKPYFLFGDSQSAVDLWFMDLAGSTPVMYVGHGSGSLESDGPGDLTATASYDRGEWTVVFRRPLREGGIVFEEGRFVPIAFSVWDGFNRERGNKRGLTRWFSFYLEPGGVKSVRGPVTKAVLATLGLELILIVWIRRRYAGGAPAA